MFNEFRSWKRKAGLVTLVLACCFAVIWLRGIVRPTKFAVPHQVGREYVIELDASRARLAYEAFTIVGLRSPKADFVIAEFCFPFWPIVVPLSGLSAWLLLSKSRQPSSLVQPQEPAI